MEVKARELEGRSLVAFRAALTGHQVFIGRVYQVLEGIEKAVIPPGICFEKSISAIDEKKLKYRLDCGNRIVSQDEESGLLSSSYDGFLALRSSHSTVEMSDAVFCWGQHDFDAWRKCYPEFSLKIHNTGSPRVDFWRKDFEPYFNEATAFLKESYGPYILIVSNFVLSNGVVGREEMIRRAWDSGRIKTDSDELEFRKLIDDDVRMFGEFSALLHCLSREFKNLNFIVRPHPAERMDAWENAVSGLENVHVCFDGGVSKWVRGALAILHNGCTTALEAYVSKVPAIAYVPFESKRNREIPNQLSVCAFTDIEVFSLVRKLMAGGQVSAQSEVNDSLIAGRLANAQGDSAAGNIVNVLSSLSRLDDDWAPQLWRAKVLDAKYRFRAWVRKKILRRFNKMDRKFPGLTSDELISIRDRLAGCDAEFSKCSVTHVYGDVFMIKREGPGCE